MINIPLLHGNWVDLIILIVILYYLIDGWGRGFLYGIIDFVSFIASFTIALKIYPYVALLLIGNFSLSRGIANAFGFLLSGFLVQTVFSFLIMFLYRKTYQQLRQGTRSDTVYFFLRLDKFLGFLPSLGEALIFTAFLLTLFVALPIQGAIKNTIISSKIGGQLVSRTQGIERLLNRVFGEAVNETLTFLTINANPSSSERVNLGFTQNQLTVDYSAEQTMFDLVNRERINRRLKPLSLSLDLQRLAREYAEDMMRRGYFSHYNFEGASPFDRMGDVGIRFTTAAENLALAPNVTLAHEGLMNSTGHRANILSPDFGKVGIGVVDGGIYGMMFVQEFTD